LKNKNEHNPNTAIEKINNIDIEKKLSNFICAVNIAITTAIK